MPTHYETRQVLAGAYRTGLKGHALLSHVAEVQEDGNVLRVLCGRVQIDSLADPCAGDPNDDPTCPVCLKQMARMTRARQ